PKRSRTILISPDRPMHVAAFLSDAKGHAPFRSEASLLQRDQDRNQSLPGGQSAQSLAENGSERFFPVVRFHRVPGSRRRGQKVSDSDGAVLGVRLAIHSTEKRDRLLRASRRLIA